MLLTLQNLNLKQILIKMDKNYIFISKGDVAQMIEYGVALTQGTGIDWYFASPLILFYFIFLNYNILKRSWVDKKNY